MNEYQRNVNRFFNAFEIRQSKKNLKKFGDDQITEKQMDEILGQAVRLALGIKNLSDDIFEEGE